MLQHTTAPSDAPSGPQTAASMVGRGPLEQDFRQRCLDRGLQQGPHIADRIS